MPLSPPPRRRDALRFSHLSFLALGGGLLVLSGCLGLSLAGEAVRSQQQKLDVVYAPGVSAGSLGAMRNFGVSVSGVDASGIVVAGGAGATNSNVYSDMISQDLLRRGYYASALGEAVTEASDAATFRRLRGRDVDVILAGSMNLSSNASVFSGITGGDFANTGVNAFTVKALDARNGRVRFILSAQYGTAKKLGKVVGDLGETLGKALGGSAPAVAQPAAAPEEASPAPVQPEAPSPAVPAPGVGASSQPMLSLLAVQRRLNEMGFTCGVPDGRMGTRTRTCLEAFQARQGLPVSGRLDQATSDAVRSN